MPLTDAAQPRQRVAIVRDVRAESKLVLWPPIFLVSLLLLETFVVVFVLVINFGEFRGILDRDPDYPMAYAGFLNVITTAGWVTSLQIFIPALKWFLPKSMCIWKDGSTFHFNGKTGYFQVDADKIASISYESRFGLMRGYFNDRGWGRGSEFVRWNGFALVLKLDAAIGGERISFPLWNMPRRREDIVRDLVVWLEETRHSHSEIAPQAGHG